MMAQVTESGQMPPWKAEPADVEYKNNFGLTSEQRKMLKSWDEAGAPRGDQSKEPAPPTFGKDWALGDPDLLLQMPNEFELKADGQDEYWNFVIKPDIKVITPNPKTSGGARWNHVAAYAWALRQPGATEQSAEEYLRKLYRNVPVLDTGARGSLTTFAQRGIGDVFISWENEAYLAKKELGAEALEIVTPSLSILAEPPVTVLDGNAKRHGTEKVAEAYLRYLYTPEAQDIIGRNFYRPTGEAAKKKYASVFPQVNLVTIDGAFGGWQAAQQRFFDDGVNTFFVDLVSTLPGGANRSSDPVIVPTPANRPSAMLSRPASNTPRTTVNGAFIGSLPTRVNCWTCWV